MLRSVAPTKKSSHYALPDASRPVSHLKLSLIENAYGFLNQSLRHYKKTGRNVHQWPFALLHLTQSVELMLKHRLSLIHRLLIFENVDEPQYTVSLDQALRRLQAAGLVINEKEKLNIRRAIKYRNLVVHYEFELNKFQWKNMYAQLFEFVHFFHHEHLKGELHARIARDNFATEARLMTFFRENFVVYNGIEVHKDVPKEILDAQRVPFFTAGKRRYQRIRYGEKREWGYPSYAELPCHDCFVKKGQYHCENCDVERCPKCGQQLIGCGHF